MTSHYEDATRRLMARGHTFLGLDVDFRREIMVKICQELFNRLMFRVESTRHDKRKRLTWLPPRTNDNLEDAVPILDSLPRGLIVVGTCSQIYQSLDRLCEELNEITRVDFSPFALDLAVQLFGQRDVNSIGICWYRRTTLARWQILNSLWGYRRWGSAETRREEHNQCVSNRTNVRIPLSNGHSLRIPLAKLCSAQQSRVYGNAKHFAWTCDRICAENVGTERFFSSLEHAILPMIPDWHEYLHSDIAITPASDFHHPVVHGWAAPSLHFIRLEPLSKFSAGSKSVGCFVHAKSLGIPAIDVSLLNFTDQLLADSGLIALLCDVL